MDGRAPARFSAQWDGVWTNALIVASPCGKVVDV